MKLLLFSYKKIRTQGGKNMIADAKCIKATKMFSGTVYTSNTGFLLWLQSSGNDDITGLGVFTDYQELENC